MENVSMNSVRALNFQGAAQEAAAVKTTAVEQPEELKAFDVEPKKQLTEDKLETKDSKAKQAKIAERQDVLQRARAKAAGWSILFGLVDTLYYALRSDNSVAKKFDLDPDEDKDFIKQIKREQALWTLPSSIPYIGFVAGIASYAYNKTLDSSKLKVTAE